MPKTRFRVGTKTVIFKNKMKIYTASDKRIVIELHKQSYTDIDIRNKTHFNNNFVRKTTTKYWEDKMKNKKFRKLK